MHHGIIIQDVSLGYANKSLGCLNISTVEGNKDGEYNKRHCDASWHAWMRKLDSTFITK